MPDETYILLLLDCSSSMRVIVEETIASMNHYIDVLRTQPGQCNVRLELFDVWSPNRLGIKTTYDSPLNEVPRLTTAIYKPRGTMPLYDALGNGIIRLRKLLASLPEQERPNRVIVVIVSDGLDNGSRQYNVKDAAKLVLHQREKYGWQFVYLGANQDAILEAGRIEIPADSSLAYNSTNIKQALNVVANYCNSYRATGQAAFTVHDRVEALQELVTGTA